MRIKLETRNGELVTYVLMLPFQRHLLPEVALWGERYFLLHNAEEAKTGAQPVYREVFCTVVGLPNMVEFKGLPTMPEVEGA